MGISGVMQRASSGAQRIDHKGFIAVGSDRGFWSVSYGMRQVGCSTGGEGIRDYLDNPPEDFLARLGILELSEDFVRLDNGFTIRRETGDGCGLTVAFTDEDDRYYSMPFNRQMKIVDAVETLDSYRTKSGLALLLELAVDEGAPVNTFDNGSYRFDDYEAAGLETAEAVLA